MSGNLWYISNPGHRTMENLFKWSEYSFFVVIYGLGVSMRLIQTSTCFYLFFLPFTADHFPPCWTVMWTQCYFKPCAAKYKHKRQITLKRWIFCASSTSCLIRVFCNKKRKTTSRKQQGHQNSCLVMNWNFYSQLCFVYCQPACVCAEALR